MKTSAWRRLSLALALANLACEQRFSSDPLSPENFASAPSPGALDAAPSPNAPEAGAALETAHAMTVTSCSSSPQPCSAAEGDAAPAASYRVLFGSGRAAVRSRGQAMADLYQALRDRTTSGERLDAEPRAAGAEAPLPLDRKSTTNAGAGSGDPIAQGAFHLLDLVDRVGEVTLDVVHGLGSNGCLVSLGRSADGGTSECLVQDPERPKAPGGKGPGVSW